MLKWEPEPVTADGASSGGAAARRAPLCCPPLGLHTSACVNGASPHIRRAPDVLAILVQIYGSKAPLIMN